MGSSQNTFPLFRRVSQHHFWLNPALKQPELTEMHLWSAVVWFVATVYAVEDSQLERVQHVLCLLETAEDHF